MTARSADYHDYVFKDGRFVGQFEEMYRHAEEMPWHQDKTAYGIFSDLDVAILGHFDRRHQFRSACDAGCGLGYFTNRIATEVFGERHVPVTGLDISETAVAKARRRFPALEFHACNLLEDELGGHRGRYDLVVAKELIWYVVDEAERLFSRLGAMTQGFIYVAQSFPETPDYHGKALFPDARALETWLARRFRLVYCVVEKDSQYGFRELAHLFAEVRQP